MVNHQPAMDDAEEKLQNLKSLSAVLLKENIERQQQVESLLQDKENLEIQLGQIAAGKTELKTEFVPESEERICLGTMKGMFSAILENQMETMGVLVSSLVRENEEKGNEIGFLKGEINGLNVKLEGERENSDQLRGKVIEMEEKKIQAEEEIRKVKEQFDEVKILRDVKVKAIEDLNRDLGEIVRKKNEIQMENDKIISSLRSKLTELEKSCENAKNMAMEYDSLVEEKNEKEITIGKLMEEMDSRERLVKNLNAELKDKDGLIETLLREKEEIEDVRVSKENQIVKLHKDLVGLRNSVAALLVSFEIEEDRKTHLESEVSHCRATLEQVNQEKHNALRDLAKETKNNKNLTSRVSEMEKSVEELAKMKKQHEKLLQENWRMECQVGLLRLEKDSVENNLLEARREVNDLREKAESGTLVMVKKAAEHFLVNGKKVLSGTEQKLDEIKLEVFKNAFRSKEAAMKGMKQQMEFLQNSVAKASKQDLWAAIISCAIVLFSVIFAYVARLR